MVVLALDTATPPGSCAVWRDGAVIAEAAGDAGLSHAERLPRELMQVLEQAQVTLADVGAFAVATGPGSFTGVRIGIATMQGLAFASARPLFGISALDALAAVRSVPLQGDPPLTATWIDAWRGEVYAALYADRTPVGEVAIGRPELVLAEYAASPIRFIGDGAATHWQQILAVRGDRASLASPAVPLLAGTIARLAGDLAAAGAQPGPEAISPVYVRRPETKLPTDDRTSR
jgi:tRNA threonylcarbamoyladenosine biosynthesis protein TsaB